MTGAGTSPSYLLRACAVVATPASSTPPEIVEFGRVDVKTQGKIAGAVSKPQSRLYWPVKPLPDSDDIAGITAQDFRLLHPSCTREVLRDAFWKPKEPHVLVTHEASRLQALIPTTAHMPLPWICTYRAAQHAWPSAPSYTLDELIEWRGLSRSGLSTSHHHLERAGAKAAAIGALVADLLRCATLNQLLMFSKVITVPLVPPPLRDDEIGWQLVPDDDLHWFATHAVNLPDYVSPCAQTEKSRRVSRGGAPHIRFDPPSLPD